MAAKYRKIDPRIWSDEKFRKLSATEKLIAMYCLTSSQTNKIGIFHLSPALACEQLKLELEPDTYRGGIKRACATLGWGIDDTVNVLYLPQWWKYNGAVGPKRMVALLKDTHDVPQTLLLQEFMANRQFLTDAESRIFDTHTIPIGGVCPVGAHEQEHEQELELEQDTPPTPPRGDAPVVFPGVLNTDAFKEAWAEWVDYRKRIRKKLVPMSVTRQLKRLEAMGHDRAIAALNHTIENTWTGIREPDTPASRGTQQSGKRTVAERRAEQREREFAGDGDQARLL